jgi:hypothetical protein
MLQHLRPTLSDDQAVRATELLQRNLARSSDWIVLNVTMDILAQWTEHHPALKTWLVRELDRLSRDRRKSVAKRASRHHASLTGS